MPDVSAKIKELNIEFNDNLMTSPNIHSGDDIKKSFAIIHKRFSQMKSAAYIDASISNNKTITLGDSNIGVVSISQNQGLTDIEKTNARTNIGAGTSNFSGSFNDLTDKPTTIAGYGITDAFSGSFTDLTNKPTTISGYGITDAKIQNGTITLGGNTITPITSFSSLDSPLVGGSGKYISSISETDGIISATETTLDTVPTENSTNAITSGAVYTNSANQQLEIDSKVTMQQAYGAATRIPANSDLNNYTTPGRYYALFANISTITNTPYTASGFHFVVEKNTLSGTATFQTLYPTSRSHFEFYRRVYEGSSWSSWYKFEGTQVASVQSVNTVSTLNLSRNDLDETLDTNIESLDTDPESFDSTPEEESESYNIDEELTEEQSE